MDATETNLQMFSNTYVFANQPREFFWNGPVYTELDQWRADTGLDANWQNFIGPFQSPNAVQTIRAALDALKQTPTLRPEMFKALQAVEGAVATTMNNNIEVMKSVWRRVERPSAVKFRNNQSEGGTRSTRHAALHGAAGGCNTACAANEPQ